MDADHLELEKNGSSRNLLDALWRGYVVPAGRFTRIKRKDRQGDLYSGDAYTWRAIIINDHTTSAEQIVIFYNKRGDSERLFDVMNNDFGSLPCSFLSANTAFMILMRIIANFYRYIIRFYSQRIPWLKATYRFKKFIFRFI